MQGPSLEAFVYRFILRTSGAVCFRQFPGPVVRGALGETLYRRVCTHPERNECTGCPRQRSCPYPWVFRPHASLFGITFKRFQQLPPPFVIRPGFGPGTYPEGSSLEFELTLLGPARTAFPLLLLTVQRLGRLGIGSRRRGSASDGLFQVERVETRGPAGSGIVWNRESELFTPQHSGWTFPDDFAGDELATNLTTSLFELQFRSPTFVGKRDAPRGSLEFGDIVGALLRRVWLLACAYGNAPPLNEAEEAALRARAQEVSIEARRAAWTETPRFSSRQRRAMLFGGWYGSVMYRGNVRPFLGLLRAGEILHVGDHTSFGFGEVRVVA